METWREIVEEMRGPVKWHSRTWQLLDEYARRIETACKTLEDVLIVEQDENAKLRRAMEPVMGVILGGSSLTDSYEAVSKAQTIMKEGAK